MNVDFFVENDTKIEQQQCVMAAVHWQLKMQACTIILSLLLNPYDVLRTKNLKLYKNIKIRSLGQQRKKRFTLIDVEDKMTKEGAREYC